MSKEEIPKKVGLSFLKVGGWIRDSPCFPEEYCWAHLLLDIRESTLQTGKVGNRV